MQILVKSSIISIKNDKIVLHVVVREEYEEIIFDMKKKKWILMSKEHQPDEVLDISREYGVPPVIATIMMNRGISDPEKFIHPSEDALLDPFLMLGMSDAVNRIMQALETHEKLRYMAIMMWMELPQPQLW